MYIYFYETNMNLLAGMNVVRAIEHIKTDTQDRPLEDCIISESGELKPEEDDGVPPPQVTNQLTFIIVGELISIDRAGWRYLG